MNNFLVCCGPCGCDSRIILDTNAIWITSIICVTIFATVFSCILFFYESSKKKGYEKAKKEMEDNLKRTKDELQDIKRKIEINSLLSKEEKMTKEFFDYCYTMAKSLEKGNEKQRKDCWKILLHIHADCIPDELKQEYKVGNNTVENVGKTE